MGLRVTAQLPSGLVVAEVAVLIAVPVVVPAVVPAPALVPAPAPVAVAVAVVAPVPAPATVPTPAAVVVVAPVPAPVAVPVAEVAVVVVVAPLTVRVTPPVVVVVVVAGLAARAGMAAAPTSTPEATQVAIKRNVVRETDMNLSPHVRAHRPWSGPGVQSVIPGSVPRPHTVVLHGDTGPRKRFALQSADISVTLPCMGH